MCGIAGIVGEVADGGGRLRRMVDALEHRGPDSEGWWSLGEDGRARAGRSGVAADGRVLLGHRRLSIIDLSHGGDQPMSSEDGRYHLVFNGEIYNYVELRVELQAQGRRFTSDSDTEVLLRAWEVWGVGALSRLRGMFAFAIVDTVARRLSLARDPFGIKPLYWSALRGHLVFGSELPAMLASGLVARRVDAQILYDFLRWGLVDHVPQTMLAEIQQLPAGHVAHVALDHPAAPTGEPFWELPEQRLEVAPIDAVDELRRRFLRSVELHLRSDVPVGTALSGGIDSSAIICAARSLQGPDAEVHAFGYLAEDPRVDEERWIDLAGEASGAIVHKVRVTSADLARDLDGLVQSQGEPFVSTSMYAQRRVFEAARDAGVTVLLDGQGADELFGGYRRFLAGQLRGLVRSGHLVRAARLAVGVARRPDTELSPAVVARVARSLVPGRVLRSGAAGSMAPPLPAWIDPSRLVEAGIHPQGNPDALGGGLAETLADAVRSTTLPSLLRYEDRNSMASSRESRVPFLDLDLASFVLTLPGDALVGRDGTTKLIFRQAMRGLVPDPILDRRDKIGFDTPGARWLRDIGPWAQSTLRGPAAARLPIDVPVCLAQLDQVLQGGEGPHREVWRWVNAARWLEIFDLEVESGSPA